MNFSYYLFILILYKIDIKLFIMYYSIKFLIFYTVYSPPFILRILIFIMFCYIMSSKFCSTKSVIIEFRSTITQTSLKSWFTKTFLLKQLIITTKSSDTITTKLIITIKLFCYISSTNPKYSISMLTKTKSFNIKLIREFIRTITT